MWICTSFENKPPTADSPRSTSGFTCLTWLNISETFAIQNYINNLEMCMCSSIVVACAPYTTLQKTSMNQNVEKQTSGSYLFFVVSLSFFLT